MWLTRDGTSGPASVATMPRCRDAENDTDERGCGSPWPGCFVTCAVALAFAAALIYLPVLQGVFGTEALTPAQLAIVAPFPFIVWGAGEIRRLLLRRYRASRHAG